MRACGDFKCERCGRTCGWVFSAKQTQPGQAELSIGFLGTVVDVPSSLEANWGPVFCRDSVTSSAPKTKLASRIAFVSTTQENPLPYFPPVASPCGPLKS